MHSNMRLYQLEKENKCMRAMCRFYNGATDDKLIAESLPVPTPPDGRIWLACSLTEICARVAPDNPVAIVPPNEFPLIGTEV